MDRSVEVLAQKINGTEAKRIRMYVEPTSARGRCGVRTAPLALPAWIMQRALLKTEVKTNSNRAAFPPWAGSYRHLLVYVHRPGDKTEFLGLMNAR